MMMKVIIEIIYKLIRFLKLLSQIFQMLVLKLNLVNIPKENYKVIFCILAQRNDNSRMPLIIDIGKRCSILLTMTPIKISLHYLPFMASELVSIIDSSCHFHTPKHTRQWSFKFMRCANSLHLVIWTYQRKREVHIWIVKNNESDNFMTDTVNVR